MKENVVVFGGSGFLGCYVVEELLSRGFNVVNADKVSPKYENDSEYFYCDISDIDSVTKVFDNKIDYVFNFAAYANLDSAVNYPIETFQLNVLGNINILEVCKDKEIKRYLFASSAYAMSSKGSFYGISKLTSEKIIEEYYRRFGLRFSIIRYGSVYSERDFENNYIYNLLKESIETGKIDHFGDGEEVREYIHAADTAKLSVDILEDEQYINECIILTGVEKMKRKELFLMVQEMLSNEVKISLKKSNGSHHYRFTPYSFHPVLSKKLVANPFIDIGQGILQCINEIYRRKGEKL